MTNLHQKIKEICTYHADEGTSGYSLSDEQFEKLFRLFEAEEREIDEKWKKILEEYRWNGVERNYR